MKSLSWNKFYLFLISNESHFVVRYIHGEIHKHLQKKNKILGFWSNLDLSTHCCETPVTFSFLDDLGYVQQIKFLAIFKSNELLELLKLMLKIFFTFVIFRLISYAVGNHFLICAPLLSHYYDKCHQNRKSYKEYWSFGNSHFSLTNSYLENRNCQQIEKWIG